MLSWSLFQTLPCDTRNDRSKDRFSVFSATTIIDEEKKVGMEREKRAPFGVGGGGKATVPKHCRTLFQTSMRPPAPSS